LIKKARMSSARLYLSGQNLLTLKSSSLTCPDPENPTGPIRWLLLSHLDFKSVLTTLAFQFMKKIFYSIVSVCLMLSMTGCNDLS
jgi:hypothetical protein